MKVESSSAQINVCDSDSFAGVNINPVLSGYAADIMFWGGAAYLCRRKDDSFLRVVMVPGEKWLQDIKDAGYEVVGSVSYFAEIGDRDTEWLREMLADYRIPYDDHPVGRRLALNGYIHDLRDKLAKLAEELRGDALAQRAEDNREESNQRVRDIHP